MNRAPVIAGVLLCVAFSIQRARAQSESPRPLVNDRCPVMNDEFASPAQEINFHGALVRFCCGKCKRRFQDDPVPFLAHLPQLSPETMQAIVAEAQGAARAAAVEDRVDRWTRPLLLTAAGLLAAWLVIRIARRRRQARGA
jgi:hypothetical protein